MVNLLKLTKFWCQVYVGKVTPSLLRNMYIHIHVCALSSMYAFVYMLLICVHNMRGIVHSAQGHYTKLGTRSVATPSLYPLKQFYRSQ